MGSIYFVARGFVHVLSAMREKGFWKHELTFLWFIPGLPGLLDWLKSELSWAGPSLVTYFRLQELRRFLILTCNNLTDLQSFETPAYIQSALYHFILQET